MSNVRRFAALNTKIKSMVGKLLSKEDYQKMIVSLTETDRIMKEIDEVVKF